MEKFLNSCLLHLRKYRISGVSAIKIIIHILSLRKHRPEVFYDLMKSSDKEYYDSVLNISIPSVPVLVKYICTFDLSTISPDVLIDAYDAIIRDSMTGHLFGQFFTPNRIRNELINTLKKYITTEHKTLYDPTCGTGSLLISAVEHLDIDIHNISGCEIVRDTYELCRLNIYLLYGLVLDNIKYNNCLSLPLCNYDIVIANPPFKLPKVNELEIRKEYIISDTTDTLDIFFQLFINSLFEKGLCVSVLPYGSNLGNHHSKYKNMRKVLFDYGDILEIIEFKNFKFKHTNGGTAGIIYRKSHTQDFIIFRSIDFLTNHRVNISVPLDVVKRNDYSLMYSEYIYSHPVQQPSNHYISDFCDLVPILKKLWAKFGKHQGKYRFYTCGKTMLYLDTYDFEDEHLIINNGGRAGVYLGDHFTTTGHHFIFKLKEQFNHNILLWLYFYFKFNIDILQAGFIGVTIPHLSIQYVMGIILPSVPDDETLDRINLLYNKRQEQIQMNDSILSDIENTLKNHFI